MTRDSLPEGWLDEPRACGAKGIYVNCRYFHGCCVRHDADYDLAVLKTEKPEDFEAYLIESDNRFSSCMRRRIKGAPLYLRPWLHSKRIVFNLAVVLWRKRSVEKVKKAGGVQKAFYRE